jgi:PII-like signaling protein
MCFAWRQFWRVRRWRELCKMEASTRATSAVMAVQVTIYLTEGDSWNHHPLHLEILKYLREENVFGAVAFHAVAGFLGRGKVRTAHLVEAGGQLPVVLSFVDTDEHVSRVLSRLKEMATHRLIVRENVVIEQGSLD